jgi:hypothetical protein
MGVYFFLLLCLFYTFVSLRLVVFVFVFSAVSVHRKVRDDLLRMVVCFMRWRSQDPSIRLFKYLQYKEWASHAFAKHSDTEFPLRHLYQELAASNAGLYLTSASVSFAQDPFATAHASTTASTSVAAAASNAATGAVSSIYRRPGARLLTIQKHLESRILTAAGTDTMGYTAATAIGIGAGVRPVSPTASHHPYLHHHSPPAQSPSPTQLFAAAGPQNRSPGGSKMSPFASAVDVAVSPKSKATAESVRRPDRDRVRGRVESFDAVASSNISSPDIFATPAAAHIGRSRYYHHANTGGSAGGGTASSILRSRGKDLQINELM